MIQPITIAPDPAWRDISLGRLKTPPPTTEPTTRAASRSSDSLSLVVRPPEPRVSVAAVMDLAPQDLKNGRSFVRAGRGTPDLKAARRVQTSGYTILTVHRNC